MSPITRLKVSARPSMIHLAASISIAMTAMAVIFWIWYPGNFAEAQGVSRLVLIMIGVDVVIGPLITLIIFDPEKKWLSLDLMAIAAFQTIALLYGLQAIHGGRPAYVVFNVDRFDLVPIKDLNRDSLSRVRDEFVVSHFGPRWVGALLPQDSEKRSAILFSAMQGGADLAQLPEYYVPLDDVKPALIERLHSMGELREINDLSEAVWSSFIEKYDDDEDKLGYLPLRANAKDGAVILDRSTGKVLDAVMLTPKF